jgi:Spy/CpxP family protein refolding chaperone
MKTIRIAMMVAALSLCMTAVAKAQEPQPQPQGQGGGRPGRGMNMQVLFKDITLTDAQKAQVDSITKKYGAERQGLMEAARNGDQEARGKIREVMTKQTDAIKAVLTDDQKKTFEKNLEEMRANMPQRPPQH